MISAGFINLTPRICKVQNFLYYTTTEAGSSIVFIQFSQKICIIGFLTNIPCCQLSAKEKGYILEEKKEAHRQSQGKMSLGVLMGEELG